MYTYFKINEKPKNLSDSEATSFLVSNANNWEKIKIEGGDLHTEILDMVFIGDNIMEAYIPKHKKLASKLLNNSASKIVGFEVYGECILKKELLD